MRSNRIYLALLFFAALFIVNCNKGPGDNNTPPPPAAAVTALDCSNPHISNIPIEDSAFTGNVQVAYSGSNGASYPAGASIASTGVTGLTAKLNAGTLTTNNGFIVFSITGRADTTGNALFNISFGGQSCTFSVPVNTVYGPVPVVDFINCALWPSAEFIHTMPYTGTWVADVRATFPTAYGPGAPIASVGVAGLTATMRAGILTTPWISSLVFDVTGTPASTGIIEFPFTFGGQSCTLRRVVQAPSTYCWQLTGVAKLACLAEEFYSLLTPAERAQTILPLTLANAKRWSWETVDAFPRNGILLENLEPAKANRAEQLMKAVMGDTGYMYNSDGYVELDQIRKMDGYLYNLVGSTAYGAKRYSINFLGTPSATGRWVLQIGGHHFAQQYLFDGGQMISISPNFRGSEPGINPWELTQPMVDEVAVSRGILMRMNTAQLAAAKLPGTFSELLMGSGASVATYPAVKQGVKMSTLSDTVKLWMTSMLNIYCKDVNYKFIPPFSTRYLAEMDDIYVSYSGNSGGVPGNAASFMNDPGDYLRLDGPNLWIEVMFVNGHAIPVKHAHAVFRDRSLDYLGL